MPTKKENNSVIYRAIKKRGMRLSFQRKNAKKAEYTYIMFRAKRLHPYEEHPLGTYITDDKEVIDFLDKHMYCKGSEANEESGMPPQFGRDEDLSLVTPTDHKEALKELEEQEKLLEELNAKVEEQNKKIKSQAATIKRRDTKLKKLDKDYIPEDEDDEDL